MTTTNLLEMRNISKSFPGVQALKDVDFSLRPGEVHALMGENGAGKSTLIKVLTGVYMPDSGHMRLDSRSFAAQSPLDAQSAGVSAIHQEVDLLPYLSVAENIYIGRQPMRWGRIDWRTINRKASEAMKRLGVDIDVTMPLGSCSVAVRQMVSIARAVDLSCKVLVMDEPTSSLDEGEVAQLFSVVRKLRSEGVGIIFITHFLDQVYEIADRITVLRNGMNVGVFDTLNLPKLELVGHMLGKSIQDVQAMFETKDSQADSPAGKVYLTAKGLGKKGAVEPFDLEIREGEVVGLAGLLGSGRTETARLLFGIDKPTSGSLSICGKPVSKPSPAVSIKLGIGYSPEDRRTEGIIPELSVKDNIVLAIQERIIQFGMVSRKKQDEIAEKFVEALNIVTPSLDQPVKNLSGGNQQKVILARWLASQPRLLILDEPTRGIDVGAKAEIEALIESFSQEGMSILFISSELDEVTRRSHRIVVMKDRKKAAELPGGTTDEQEIMKAIAGGDTGEG